MDVIRPRSVSPAAGFTAALLTRMLPARAASLSSPGRRSPAVLATHPAGPLADIVVAATA